MIITSIVIVLTIMIVILIVIMIVIIVVNIIRLITFITGEDEGGGLPRRLQNEFDKLKLQ